MDKSYNQNQINQTEIRKVQTIHGNSTFILVLPKDFVSILNISKGDYVKCKISNHQLIIEKSRSLKKDGWMCKYECPTKGNIIF